MGMHEYEFLLYLSCNAGRLPVPRNIKHTLFSFAKEKSTNLVKKIIISECSKNLNKQVSAPLFIQNCAYFSQGLIYNNEVFA